MSKQHLKDLRNALEANHWRVTAELPGNDYDISAFWKIARPDGSSAMEIFFEGFDDLQLLPIEKAYACGVRELPDQGLYFGRISRSWKPELAAFMQRLNNNAVA